MEKSVCILIKHYAGDKYLAVARRGTTDQWGLPGGKVEPGEDLKKAAIRELYEETGHFLIPNGGNILTEVFSEVCGPGKDGKIFHCTTFYVVPGRRPCGMKGDAGPVDWVTQEELENGPFGEYNKALFKAVKLKELLK